jgi:D-sedoheptulose 7-phosphate isomerase
MSSPETYRQPPTTDLETVRANMIASTEQKLSEVARLRESLAAAFPIEEAAHAIATRLLQGGRLLTFGNGASATDAAALAWTFTHPPYGTPLAAVSLAADAATMSGLSNDVSFAVTFSRLLASLAREHDVAVGISTHADSLNVLRGLNEARRLGLLTVGFAGNTGGKMAAAGDCQYLFVIPTASAHRIQEAQTTLFHLLWKCVQDSVKTR